MQPFFFRLSKAFSRPSAGPAFTNRSIGGSLEFSTLDTIVGQYYQPYKLKHLTLKSPNKESIEIKALVSFKISVLA